MLRRDRWMKKLWLTDWLTELTEGKVLSSFLLWWAFHLTLLWPSSLILCFLSDSSTKLHSLSSVSLSGGVSPIVGVDTGLTWDEHALYPRKWCFVLTSESLWPYQQWNACDKSHWESALEKWASVCKTISIYPQRSPLFFFFFFLMWVFYPVGEALTRCHEWTHAASALKGALCHIAAPGPHFFRCWDGGKSSSANVYHMT